jgi:Na+/H+ antiporter NhaD/arsenite permease-like protein
VAATSIHKHQLKMSFVDFGKAASPFAFMQIVMAMVYVLVFL